jgi:uncharacterized OB-fold protein
VIESIPLPTLDDPVDAPFWAGCRHGQLLIQHCADCGRAHHPPRAMCPHCRADAFVWRPAAGTGRLWSYAVPNPPLLPAFAALLPYVVGVVELDDHPGLRLVGALAAPGASAIGGVDPAQVGIGAPVAVHFIAVTDDTTLPCWTLSTPTPAAIPAGTPASREDLS